MFTSISSVRTSNSTMRGSSSVRLMSFQFRIAVFFIVFATPLDSSSAFDRTGNQSLFPADAVVFQRKFVILSQRVPFPVFGTQNSPQVGMIGEIDSHQIVRFALVPVGDGPDVRV